MPINENVDKDRPAIIVHKEEHDHKEAEYSSDKSIGIYIYGSQMRPVSYNNQTGRWTYEYTDAQLATLLNGE